MHNHPILSGAALAGLALMISACSKPADTAGASKDASASPAIETLEQRASYGIGHNVGANISRQGGLDVDRAAFIAGLDDGLKDLKPRVGEDELQAAFTTLQERVAGIQAKAAEANTAKADAFLAENRSRPGVTVTGSGLQYEVLSSGTGPKPVSTDTVEVHYHGTLIDGTVFDSSVQRGETIEFAVTGVIKGWVEALQLMSVGDKWKLFIPPGLAYGTRATGKIPANSALIFEVELIGIK